VIPWLRPGDAPEVFPPVETALSDPNGLLCAGGDLRPERLLAAYRRGIFPWYAAGQPILWWSPDPRAVLQPGEFHVSRSLARSLRNRGYAVSIDTAFASVVAHCGDRALRPEGTWITPAMRDAYQRLHELGYAHSVETRRGSTLVGGIYGVAVGRVFFGESMFSLARDASKVAMAHLVQELIARGLELLDCQIPSPHLATLGVRAVSRRSFVSLLQQWVDEPMSVGVWRTQ
jgi:leucyl/phenylalanyl-tRNA---protein transferase